MMNRAIMIITVASLLPLCAEAGQPDSSALLAEWDGGGITVGQYVKWWQRMPDEERPELGTLEAKREFLENVVNAQIMLSEAKAQGEDRHPNVVDWISDRKRNMLREYLFNEAAKGRIEVDEQEVQRLLDRRRTQITASHIVVPTLEQANALRDSLEWGIPFAGLASRYSTCASGANEGSLGLVRWGDFSDRWSTEAFSLEPGEISEPFEVEGGYCIVKVDAKVLADLADPEGEEAGIRARLTRDATFAERQSLLDSLKLAYDVDLSIAGVVDLCARYAQALADLGVTTEVIDADVVPPLTDSEKARPVVTFEGGRLSYGDVVDIILSEPYVVRPRFDDPDEMIPFINRQINDTLVMREAHKRGLDKRPQIADELEKLEQRRTITRFYNVMTGEVEVPEDTLRQFFEAHAEDFKIQPGHYAGKIVLRNKAAADSVLERIEQGESFEEIARERSIDPFTAPAGGNMGFLPKGKDPEFDGFLAQMKADDIKVFRSVEGHVVLWLHRRIESKTPTFEEAREAVGQQLRPAYKHRYLQQWLSERRRELNVRTNASLLEELDLPG
jgi:peptidyl-prolyl cis-trans isomerase C